MPDLAAFEQEVLTRLQTPVNDYYDVVERSAFPVVGLAGGVFQPLLSRLTINRAQARLRTELRSTLTMAYQVAGALGNNSQAMDALQNQQVLSRLAEALNYLDGFIADLNDMSRAQALARIAKYVAPVMQMYSVTATSDLPELPIYPGDSRLECSRKIRACLCTLDVVRVGPNDWDVFWRQHSQEGCRDCVALAQAWNPLKIRRGRILSQERAA